MYKLEVRVPGRVITIGAMIGTSEQTKDMDIRCAIEPLAEGISLRNYDRIRLIGTDTQ